MLPDHQYFVPYRSRTASAGTPSQGLRRQEKCSCPKRLDNHSGPATGLPILVKETVTALFGALRHRNYRLYWIGHLVSSTGTWAQIVAMGWLVYRLSHSAMLLGAVGLASRLPVFVFGLVAGVAADRFHRRRVILIAQSAAMIQTLVLAALTLTGHIEIWHLFLLALGIGTTTAFDIPARQSFFIEIAGRSDLANAVALNSGAFQTARMVGPAFAALLLAAGQNEGACFLLNGVSYLVMIFAVVAIGVTNDVTARNNSPHLLGEMKEGLRFAWNHQTIRYLLLFLSTLSFWGVSYVVLMPIFSAEMLGSGPEGLGILMSASGLGSVVGALFVAARASRGGPDSVRGVATGCGVGLAFALMGFAASHHLWLSSLFSAVLGGLLMTLAATVNTCIQLLIPDDLRGRVMSLYITCFVGSVSFGHFFAGLVAGRTGAATAVMLAGIAALGITVVLSRKLPALPPSVAAQTADPALL